MIICLWEEETSQLRWVLVACQTRWDPVKTYSFELERLSLSLEPRLEFHHRWWAGRSRWCMPWSTLGRWLGDGYGIWAPLDETSEASAVHCQPARTFETGSPKGISTSESRKNESCRSFFLEIMKPRWWRALESIVSLRGLALVSLQSSQSTS